VGPRCSVPCSLSSVRPICLAGPNPTGGSPALPQTLEAGRTHVAFGLIALCLAALCTACGPSEEDLVADLAGDAEQRAAARQELLLAKDRAVEPLLEALDDPDLAASRPLLIDVLVSLMMRVDDDRILAALVHHLQSDPSPAVRARVARSLAMHRRLEAVDALVAATSDTAAQVRHQALLALGAMDDKLTPEQAEAVTARAAALVGDAHPGVQTEARIRVESGVGDLLQEAASAGLSAQTAEAESLLSMALSRAPTSKRAQYRLGRFYYDNDHRDKGLALLRQQGMLLDVHRLRQRPVVDGRLEEDEAWSGAARSDSFYVYSHRHAVALPASRPTRLYLGYTDQALYVGLWAYDEHPDSLVAVTQPGAEGNQVGRALSGSIWRDDVVELFLDADFDHQAYAHIGINSLGAVSPEWIAGPLREAGGDIDSWADGEWRPKARLGVHVGDDHWSIEYAIDFEPLCLPRPATGTVWGFNAVRTYRGQEYNQWTRTYGGGHSPDDFGILLFH